ncbi:hypothetical protein CSOJ01_05749 [Colletotrichum sojae]|uniref:Uncharacterized protein n=1 Tax=Colletotrichum sojae TaxID=2175907 RepID=A0A8H6MWE0_9PEZI|nr:hypothetical protein CSOJ01_05749 [Colletotrichum sojae]
MSQLRWDQALALAVVVCGVLEHPRVCLCLAVSWMSWDTVISLYAVLGIFPFLDKVVGPVARSLLLERRRW